MIKTTTRKILIKNKIGQIKKNKQWVQNKENEVINKILAKKTMEQ